jgi:hypothetical protein
MYSRKFEDERPLRLVISWKSRSGLSRVIAMNSLSSKKILQPVKAPDLMELATEQSPERRLELLRRLTDAYSEQTDQRSSAAEYLLDEIVRGLLSKVSRFDRIQASVDLSKLPALPDVLVRTLATDSDFEVARPIVCDYRGLSEEILVDAAKSGSQECLSAIAARSVITPPVTDVVAKRGDQNAVRALAANKSAQFSSEGMETLISKAESDGVLQELIVSRTDLSIEAVGKLLPMISQELAARLGSKTIGVGGAVMRQHFTDWMRDRNKNVAVVDSYIDGIRKGDLKLNDVVIELIRSKRLLDTATVLAAMIFLDRHYTFNVLTKGNAQSTMLLLKSMQLSWPVVDSFLKLRRAKTGADDMEAPVERREYEAIDLATAQRIVRFMKVRRTAMASSGGNAEPPVTELGAVSV